MHRNFVPEGMYHVKFMGSEDQGPSVLAHVSMGLPGTVNVEPVEGPEKGQKMAFVVESLTLRPAGNHRSGR